MYQTGTTSNWKLTNYTHTVPALLHSLTSQPSGVGTRVAGVAVAAPKIFPGRKSMFLRPQKSRRNFVFLSYIFTTCQFTIVDIQFRLQLETIVA